jgi:MoaA/NifB/PqqE/SkfB family radical SAM enzyme
MIQHILDSIKDIDKILLTGGEPTLNPEIEKIIDILRTKNIKIYLVTNGTIPDKIKIIRNKLDKIFVSFISIDNEIDFALCGNKSNFEQRIQTIKLLRTHNDAVANIVVNKKNIHTLRETTKFLKENGLKVKITYPIFSGQFFNNYNELYVSYLDLKSQLDKMEFDYIENIPPCISQKNSLDLNKLKIDKIITIDSNNEKMNISSEKIIHKYFKVEMCRNCKEECKGILKNNYEIATDLPLTDTK